MESNRKHSFTLLSLAIKKYFESIATSVSKEDFCKILETSLQQKSTTAEKLYNIYVNRILKKTTEIWEAECEEQDLNSKFEILENQIQKYSDHTAEAWRPETGNCNATLTAYYNNQLLKHKEKLEDLVYKLEYQCEALKQEVVSKRERMSKNEIQLDKCKEKLMNINKDLDTVLQEQVDNIESFE